MRCRGEDALKSKIPAGESGDWKVIKFTVTELDQIRSMMGGAGRYVPPGNYTRLQHLGHTIMSDTPDELRDFSYFVNEAEGSILINGLGLGCVVQALLDKPEVTDIIVIEKEQDVLNLVVPHLLDPRLTVIHADAFEWQPPKNKRWNYVWHDIWPDLCTDNLKEMAKLHRKYGRRCDNQDSWSKELLKYRKRQEDRQDAYWG